MRMLLAAAIIALGVGAAHGQAEPATIAVWKTPSCGCCGDWVEVVRAAGFEVAVTDLGDLSMLKELAGIPRDLASCHTAMIDGYAIEGHVPVVAIRRLLRERPAIAGLSAPGMPLGSPGMSGPPEAFDVMAFDGEDTEIWGTYRGDARID